MILVVDNYDSFTFNLVQALQAAGADVRVVRNDAIDEARRRGAGRRPRRRTCAGSSSRRARATRTTPASRWTRSRSPPSAAIPLLGVCLGHAVDGRGVRRDASSGRPTLVHGEASEVTHDGAGLLEGMPPSFMAARYHSLAIDPATLPPELRVTAMSEVDRVDHGHPSRRAAARGRPVPPRDAC